MKAYLLLVAIATCFTALLAFDNIDNSGIQLESREVKCLVCRATVKEMLKAIGKVDPRKRVEVSGFRIDGQGNTVTKSVLMTKSETYLTELLEEVCDRMDDYVKARFKKSKKLTVLKLMDDSGMNPLMSSVDFVQDGDLNKSLKHFCHEALEDNDEAVIKAFQHDPLSETIADDLCQVAANYCDQAGDVEPTAEDLAEPEKSNDFPGGLPSDLPNLGGDFSDNFSDDFSDDDDEEPSTEPQVGLDETQAADDLSNEIDAGQPKDEDEHLCKADAGQCDAGIPQLDDVIEDSLTVEDAVDRDEL